MKKNNYHLFIVTIHANFDDKKNQFVSKIEKKLIQMIFNEW